MTKPWTSVTVTTASEMNPNNAAVDPHLEEFCKDLLARLPQLGERDALRYTFADAKTADRYRNRGRDEMNARGYPVRTILRKADGAAHVYFRPADTPTKSRPRPKADLKPAPATPVIVPNPAPARERPPDPEAAAKAPPAADTPAWSTEVGLHDARNTATVRDLEAGRRTWRVLTNSERRPLVVAYLHWLHRTHHTLTQADFNKYKPGFMPTAWGCMQNLNYSAWSAFLKDLIDVDS